MSLLPQLLPGLIFQLSGEGASAYAGAIGFENPNHFTDAPGCDAEACAGSRGGGVGGCHERVRAKINIQQSALSSFGQYFLSGSQIAVYQVFAIYELQPGNNFNRFEALCFFFFQAIIGNAKIVQEGSEERREGKESVSPCR